VAIKSGTVGDMLKRNTGERTFFLSDASIESLPDTKPRDVSKRSKVIALEMAIMIQKFDVTKFPLKRRSDYVSAAE
jgi:hypothetical protein